MKPLLTRIEEELAICSDPYRRAELMGEKGCYLARVGDFGAARTVVGVLRLTFRDGDFPPPLAWAMLIEGLIYYFENLSTFAFDRVRRSYECGRALGMRMLRDLAAAWWAHLQFERSSFVETADLLRRIDLADPACPNPARIRSSMVLADALLFAGQRESAKRWFTRAHQYAIDSGDQAAVGALMYNRAVFSLALMRAETALLATPVDAKRLNFAAMELSSARSFENAIRVHALEHLVDVWQVRVHVLRGEFARAVEHIRRLVHMIDQLEERPNKSHIVGDLMLCELKLGNVDEATKIAAGLLGGRGVGLDVDDRLVLASQLVEVFTVTGDTERVLAAEHLREEARNDYVAAILTLRQALSSFEEG